MDDLLGASLVASDHALGNALEAITTAELAELLGGIEQIKNLRTSLATVSAELEHRAGVLMGEKSVDVNGTVWERSMPPKRSGWKSDDLLRAVLDTRRVDPESGEVLDETPLQKVQHVYPLAGYQARLGALKERGLDPDDFSEASWDSRRWKVARQLDKRKRGKR